ncbi:MAG: SusF/SusE family outer membrane protein [Muribaculaceae bacterium]|nr:SusF/SusE family outer membrane protein [Muribaculaceae bacterium]
MKKSFNHIPAIILCGLALTACTDNDYMELDKGHDTLALSAFQSADVLDEALHSSEAISLSWTTGTNYGTGNRISYTLEIAPAGSGFADAYTAVDQQTQTYSWSVSQENLNALLLDKFGGVADQSQQLDARVTAHVIGQSEVQTATLTFAATPYAPVTSTLYLVGDATPNGWDNWHATEMKRIDNGQFTWEGNLRPGSFKFLTTLGEWIPSYNRDSDGRLVLRNSFDEPDEQWQITEEHYYQVNVNLLTREMTYVQTDGEAPRFENLYFVGQPTGWGFVKMQRDPLDPFLFRYGRFFESGNGGEFKFGTSEGAWENMLKATQANAPYTDTSMEFVAGYDPDNKWFLQESETNRAYKICVDIRSDRERMMMREFSPYEMIYLVGDAAPCGWDLGNATAMTATESPYIFTWTGNLNTGELKFSCDKQSDWNGAWLMNAYGNGIEPTGDTEQALFINKSDDFLKAQYLDVNIGDVDNKWRIMSAGTYTITINQLDETVSIVKQ